MQCLSHLVDLFTPKTMSLTSSSTSVDLLVLGGGWTYTFLKPLLEDSSISHVATTRDGRDGTLKWVWDSESDDDTQYDALPRAKTVLIVFPLKGQGMSKRLVEGYEQEHGSVKWIQLGSTGIYDGGPTLAAASQTSGSLNEKSAVDSKGQKFEWTTRHSEYATDNPRAIAEDELLSLRADAFVLNLCGLWGGTRDPANWFQRIAPSKAALRAKGSVHFIHGLDVARAVIAVHLSPSMSSSSVPAAEPAKGPESSKGFLGRRYLLTDLRVYDWWDLASAWAAEPSAEKAVKDAGNWVRELLREHNVRALPRTPEVIGRALDSREFWEEFGLNPVKGRWERARL
ncbi:BQ5605_C034g11335 [Microbotryum silenes-dioicae]|uniref:BQ5605_C034g11335 protein n=1 Tax=Microbotryum silenes-dioicae TaxID=796604 RepID=A0A2X0N9Q9_9BASI|nr:BQ5605_C034g11335 [Microbotryum silenes-dioicae]